MSFRDRLAADLDAFFADGVAVVYGAQQTTGQLLEEDVVQPSADTGFEAVTRATVLQLATSALAGLVADAAITVDGRAFVIRAVRAEADGLVTTLLLAPA